MRAEIHVYGEDSVFFAACGHRYSVVYVEDGVAVRQEFFDSKEELKLNFAVRNVGMSGGTRCGGWPEPGGHRSACLILDV